MTALMQIRELSVLNYAHGFTSWHYRAGAPLTLAEVHGGFFEPAADMVAPGDMIHVSASDGGCILFVDSTAGGVVTRTMASTS